jgi:hypothetical protein
MLWDSTFRSDDVSFAFGDQEEMGLGLRMATPIRVKGGKGEMVDSEGRRNEKEIRGANAEWVDYSATVGGERVGLMLMPSPQNFRPSWYHARDYGLLVANAFGRKALTRGEASRVVVDAGAPFRLRFGVLVHSSPADKPIDLNAAYRDYLEQERASETK